MLLLDWGKRVAGTYHLVVGGMLLGHVAFTFEDGFESFIRLYFMFIIWLIVFYGFFINVKFFGSIRVDSFLLKNKMDTVEKFYIYKETVKHNHWIYCDSYYP
jgi:hypothetical protein